MKNTVNIEKWQILNPMAAKSKVIKQRAHLFINLLIWEDLFQTNQIYSLTFKYFLVDCLVGNLIVLFMSSHDSTKASISWLLLYMAEYPDIQKKIHDEIDSVVGRDGIIYFDDKAKFPYTMATIFEVLRHVSIAPLTPPRM